MHKSVLHLAISVLAFSGLSGCIAVKTAGFVTETAAKTVYKTGEFTAKGVIGTGKVVGKGVMGVGKGVYYAGKVPIDITDRALKTTSGVLTVTTQTVDLTGKVISTTRQIQAYQLDAELGKIRRAGNIIRASVDTFS